MNEATKNRLLSDFLVDAEITKEVKVRKSEYYNESYPNGSSLLSERLADGWQVVTELKTTTKINKEKPQDVAFQDKVWALFALLGFKYLNKGRLFEIPYDKKNTDLKHEVNVFAKDEETVLIIECRVSSKDKVGDFSEDLEAIKARKQGILNSITALFPGDKPKFKYILATSRLDMTEADEAKLKNIDGEHFSEEIIDYYYFLQSQIGIAARYQLLGALFSGKEIPDMDSKIPAIEGKMGGHTYYSFSIEPDKLLKIGYVLHRSKANESMMPTYQRLIKKSRLKEIHSFIDDQQGYFPNSIIINLVTEKNRKLIFEPSSNQPANAISRIGVLHLPKKYKSAYIIDGQHRLYGYANSKYKLTNTIPVVALVNIDRSEQVRLFMQINENQKAVSKDLRNTLDADLLWDSESYTDQMKALKSKIAINLGENRQSPFFGKISIGEDKRIITTEYVNLALNRADFLGKVKKHEVEVYGTFFSGNIDKTYRNLSEFLFKSFNYIKANLEEMWEQEGNIILINKGFYGITLLLNDLVNYVKESGQTEKLKSPKLLFEAIQVYLDSVIKFFRTLTEEKIVDLKTSYGTPGDAKYWRTLQLAVRSDHPEISYKGLDEYLKKEEKENNERAFLLIREIESTFLKDRIRDKLEVEYGKAWFKKGLPDKVYTDAMAAAARKNQEIENDEDEKDPWDQLHLIQYREIILKNWQKLFDKMYSQPGIGGNKENKTGWLVELNRIRNENFHTYYVTGTELSFIESIHDWLSERQ